MENFKAVMQTIGQILYMGFSAIGGAVVWCFNKFIEWIQTAVIPMMPTMLKLFSNKKINVIIFLIIACYIAVMNIAAFSAFGADKSRAKKKQGRIREKTLMRLCFWGGAGGGLIGMNVFRHKTMHKKFSVGIPVMFILQLLFDSFILGFLGFWAFF